MVSGLIAPPSASAIGLGVERYADIEQKLTRAIADPIPPVYVETSATREVTQIGDEVDLFNLPVPMSSILDGGPMITAGVTIVRDGDGLNAGIYRFLLKEKNLTGIDIVTPTTYARSPSAHSKPASRCRFQQYQPTVNHNHRCGRRKLELDDPRAFVSERDREEGPRRHLPPARESCRAA